jgi:hypothetical protein
VALRACISTMLPRSPFAGTFSKASAPTLPTPATFRTIQHQSAHLYVCTSPTMAAAIGRTVRSHMSVYLLVKVYAETLLYLGIVPRVWTATNSTSGSVLISQRKDRVQQRDASSHMSSGPIALESQRQRERWPHLLDLQLLLLNLPMLEMMLLLGLMLFLVCSMRRLRMLSLVMSIFH